MSTEASAVSPRVLIADDNAELRKLIPVLLHDAPLRVTLAADGKGAYDAFLDAHGEVDPFLFVVLDYQMPEMNGVEVAQKIRAFESETGAQAVPLAFFTGYFEDLEERQTEGLATAGIWRKPSDMRDMCGRMLRAIEGMGAQPKD